MNPIISPDGRHIIDRDKICWIDLKCQIIDKDFMFAFVDGSRLAFKMTPEWKKILNELMYESNLFESGD